MAKKLAKGMGKAFSRYFTQIPWENIGPLSATAAPSLKVKKDFQRIYEFQAEPERQTKPSIYICEQVRAKNSEILSSQTSLPRQEMEILKFKKHNLRCSQRFGGRRENGWCLRSTKKKKTKPSQDCQVVVVPHPLTPVPVPVPRPHSHHRPRPFPLVVIVVIARTLSCAFHGFCLCCAKLVD